MHIRAVATVGHGRAVALLECPPPLPALPPKVSQLQSHLPQTTLSHPHKKQWTVCPISVHKQQVGGLLLWVTLGGWRKHCVLWQGEEEAVHLRAPHFLWEGRGEGEGVSLLFLK